MTSKQNVTIYTDGSCLKNPGPGGWAFVSIQDGKENKMSGGATDTTNNRMELMAVINALSSLQEPCSIVLHSDSQYVVKAFTEGWLRNWKANGWKTTTGEVKNKDLWKLLMILVSKHDITWKWVKGHAGNRYNELCDQMAVAAAKHYQQNGDTPLNIPKEEADPSPSEGGPANEEGHPSKDDQAEQEVVEALSKADDALEPVGMSDEPISIGEGIEPPEEDFPHDVAFVDIDMDESLFIHGVPEDVPENNVLAPERDPQHLMKCLELLLQKYNEAVSGIPFPCGSFEWCAHCASQAPQENDCVCAKAYITYLTPTNG